MLHSTAIVLLVMAAQEAQPTIVQRSSGWCSPNIAHVAGNVSVNCIGVDPRALKRLNAELNRKNLQLSDKIREADEWTAKYNELEARFSEAGDDSALSRQAEEYLHEGELEKAGAVLDQVLQKEQKQVDLIAANHYNRALIFEMEYRPQDALPHLEKAYGYHPDEWKYGDRYGYALLMRNDYSGAEPVLLVTLANARRLARANAPAYQPHVAATLDELALLYRYTNRLKEAEAALQEALGIYRPLIRANAVAYQWDASDALMNLGAVYYATERMKEAEDTYEEALAILRANPAAYRRKLIEALEDLGDVYRRTQRMREAEAVYQEALDSCRQLAITEPDAYQAYLSSTLTNLANLYLQAQRMTEAEAAYQEALSIRRQLVKIYPDYYQGQLANTLDRFGD